jgi:hypothetical protein
MTIDDWLRAVTADADARGLPQLKPLLESLAVSTRRLRDADSRLRREDAARNEADTPGAGGRA